MNKKKNDTEGGMDPSRLAIVQIENNHIKKNSVKEKPNLRSIRRNEAEALFERMWLLNPEKFDPMRNARERERMSRTWKLIQALPDEKSKKVVDVGCGWGVISRKLRDAGASVDAVDIANNALKLLRSNRGEKIETIQEALPITRLPDDTYDLVVCTDVIAELNPEDFRLAFAELSRIITAKGHLIFSTPLDIYSEDALQHLITLVETEFKIEQAIYSYHALYIRLLSFFETPYRFYLSWRDPDFRQQQLKQRGWLGRCWYRLNSLVIIAHTWGLISYLMQPLTYMMEQSRWVLLGLEAICRFFSGEAGISHALFSATRRSIMEPPPTDAQLQEAITQNRPPFRKERKWE